MKKENKQLARERKAQARKKEQERKKMKKAAGWIMPAFVIAFVVVALVFGVIAGISVAKNKADKTSAEKDVGSMVDDVTSNITSYIQSSAASETDTTLDTTAGREVKSGDIVNIDYTGYLDGEAFDGGSTNGAGTDLELGSGQYIEGFEDAIIGHKVGDTFKINVTFPESYSATNLAGKDTVFEITINGVRESQDASATSETSETSETSSVTSETSK